METVEVSREFDADVAALGELIADVDPFMRAAGFHTVEVDGDRIRIENTVGLFLQLELVLEIVERENAVLAYVQCEGIFEDMETVYRVEKTGDGSTVTATTRFAIDVEYVGPFLDTTVVKRQRRAELTRQLDYLEEGGD